MLTAGVKYNLVSESWVDHNRQFTMKVTVDGQDFEGTGWNKKSAKTEAAKSAVNKIFNILTVPSELFPLSLSWLIMAEFQHGLFLLLSFFCCFTCFCQLFKVFFV